jgi:hypothetical protein
MKEALIPFIAIFNFGNEKSQNMLNYGSEVDGMT